MKFTIIAAFALLSLAPAYAQEGNGEPFHNNASTFEPHASVAVPVFVDTGSSAYPSYAGRPGSNLPHLAGNVLPSTSSEGGIQTANSLPAGFEQGTVAYAQATQVHNWVLAHAKPRAPAMAVAFMPALRDSKG